VERESPAEALREAALVHRDQADQASKEEALAEKSGSSEGVGDRGREEAEAGRLRRRKELYVNTCPCLTKYVA
jgi:hypothetical protein